MPSPLHTFLVETYGSVNQRWVKDYVTAAAGRAAPGALHGPAEWLVRGDINVLWARWFAEGVADPNRYLETDLPYAHVYQEVRNHLAVALAEQPDPEKDELAAQLTDLIVEEIERRRDKPGRHDWPKALREKLWDDAGQTPRCWICGYAFSDGAAAKFLKQKGAAAASPQPVYVDVFQPRGLHDDDLRIEVDHVGALAGGGNDDDLRLACGWCNRAKSDRSLFYDASAVLPWFEHPALGRVGVPHRFWIVRALAMQRQCQHMEGCAKSIATDEMRVALARQAGAPNPVNLRVLCSDHDTMAGHRFVLRASYPSRLHKGA